MVTWVVKYTPNEKSVVDFYAEMPALYRNLSALRVRHYKFVGHDTPQDDYVIVEAPDFINQTFSNDPAFQGSLAVLEVDNVETSRWFSPAITILSLPAQSVVPQVNRLRIRLKRPNGEPLKLEACYLIFEMDTIF